MKLGLVSNVWKTQLDDGASLRELIGQAVQHNYRTIELRQTCLGEFEIGDDHRPQPNLLALLPEEFPGVRFNVAINVSFLDAEFSANDSMFEASRMAAFAVAGSTPPHLRLVDLGTRDESFLGMNVDDVAEGLVALATSMRDLDGVLSIEHSLQSWEPFYAAFRSARRMLGPDANRLKLCFDPCNLLMSPDAPDPNEVTRELQAEELSMVHIKQRSSDGLLENVNAGEIDWSAQCQALNDIGFRQPYLFEVASSRTLWEQLDESLEYLRDAGFDF